MAYRVGKFSPVIYGNAQQRVHDLHDLRIETDGGPNTAGHQLADHSALSACGCATVYFRDLEDQMIRRIRASDFVFGCVAWLTSEPILRALAGLKYGCQIVVQKEDFLRPDGDPSNAWRSRLRALYEELHCGFSRQSMPDPLPSMSVCSDWSIAPVRCVGNHNAERVPAFPRMHNKFIVFCSSVSTTVTEDGETFHGATYSPRSVWTGSFNFTANAGRSFENALVLTDPAIVRAYVAEYAQILALSEALDWSSVWVAPEWRIGT